LAVCSVIESLKLPQGIDESVACAWAVVVEVDAHVPTRVEVVLAGGDDDGGGVGPVGPLLRWKSQPVPESAQSANSVVPKRIRFICPDAAEPPKAPAGAGPGGRPSRAEGSEFRAAKKPAVSTGCRQPGRRDMRVRFQDRQAGPNPARATSPGVQDLGQPIDFVLGVVDGR
jgi:hypothetical protein